MFSLSTQLFHVAIIIFRGQFIMKLLKVLMIRPIISSYMKLEKKVCSNNTIATPLSCSSLIQAHRLNHAFRVWYAYVIRYSVIKCSKYIKMGSTLLNLQIYCLHVIRVWKDYYKHFIICSCLFDLRNFILYQLDIFQNHLLE